MLKTVRDFNVQGKRVLVRCDFNIPLNKRGGLLDDFRIQQTIPTIKYLIKNNAKVILMSHLGRPDDSRNSKKIYTLKLIVSKLSELLGKKVKFLNDCIGKDVEREISNMKDRDIVLLENLRFYKEEKQNNKSFAKKLAKLGDIYINDAFAVCHRSHSSTVGITEYLPSGSGLLLEKEIKIFKNLMKNSEHPLMVLAGGKKVETKAKFIDKISQIADCVLIANLIGDELKEKHIKLKFSSKIIYSIDGICYKGRDLDIGPKTIKLFKEKILEAKTIFWNGPLGAIEEERFSNGSLAIAKAIIKSKAYSIVGGGDTVAFLGKRKLRNKFNYVSTGGGAMLKFLSNEKLPGIEVLRKF